LPLLLSFIRGTTFMSESVERWFTKHAFAPKKKSQ
jgi:hypothetical protein